MVTLDAFSGAPNPTWDLGVDQTAELMSMWDDLTMTTAPPEGMRGLGYRGVFVQFEDGSRLWVSQGVAVDEAPGRAVFREDANRALELWLLETGRPSLDEGLLDSILVDIAAG